MSRVSDCHGQFGRFKHYDDSIKNDPETAVIILGDVGLNINLNDNDSHVKNSLSKKYKFRIYCLKGNHEARPSDVSDMKLMYDEDVNGQVWYQERWPNIRYFKEYGEYNINGHSVLCIGCAYSIDKIYRIRMGWPWFSNEQLTDKEKSCIEKNFFGKNYDFIFSHTCPYSLQPTDLFLSSINQFSVDNSMEKWLDKVRLSIKWKIWLWGHYHEDRIEQPYCEMFFNKTENLETIWTRWINYENNHKLSQGLSLGPKYNDCHIHPSLWGKNGTYFVDKTI